uniref:Uncharacterized protein n=1 Tax=Rhizophora mucronata TaxID=61149 RepID=A0A2P2QF89_RHIMU
MNNSFLLNLDKTTVDMIIFIWLTCANGHLK